jgi:hypothetical protein
MVGFYKELSGIVRDGYTTHRLGHTDADCDGTTFESMASLISLVYKENKQT